MKISTLLIWVPLIIFNTLLSQTDSSKAPVIYETFLLVGYSNPTPNNVHQYYDLILNSYNSAGIPITRQMEFGSVLILSGGILLTRIEDIWTGLSLGYSYSPAFSSYKDFAGTLKIKGVINSFDISLKTQATLTKVGNVPIHVSLEPGLNYTSTAITQELTYYNYSAYNYNSKWSASGWGPCATGILGSSVELGGVTALVECGYRFSWNFIDEENIISSSGDSKMFEHLNLGQSGIVFRISLGMRL